MRKLPVASGEQLIKVFRRLGYEIIRQKDILQCNSQIEALISLNRNNNLCVSKISGIKSERKF